ncbi:MAG: ABC transporter permease [Acidobacteria bacterium]|nr:MAG: ABC transporter permease [Acidobacteriota bacterium]
MDALWRDLRYALRGFGQRPGFAAVAILTLALGIGANVAIFTVAYGVLIAPLPYPDAGRIVVVLESAPALGYPRFSIAPPNYVDFRDQNTVFSHLAATSGGDLSLTGAGDPVRLRARRATWEYFPVLGVEPRLGRVFGPADDRPGAPKVAVLGHAVWQRYFGGDAAVVGRTVELDGEPHEVIGVMPEEFSPDFDVFVPLAMDYAAFGRGGHFLGAVARLKPGVDLERARAEMKAIAARLEAEYPDSNTGWSAVVDPLRELLVEDVRPALLLLLAAVALVLLIACANVANLMLARMALREREIALRIALGAGRGRLIRQLLAESTLLSLAGGALGVGLAIYGTRALVAMNAGGIPLAEEIGVDPQVLAFALVLSLATGLLFGLLPALQASRPNLTAALKEGGGGQSGGVRGRRLRSVLVLAQVAVALVLLIGAGLLLKSFARLLAIDPGFEPAGALTAQLALPEIRYRDDESQVAFYRQLFEQLNAEPGIDGVGAIFPMPLTGSGFILTFAIEGRGPSPPNEGPFAHVRVIGPGYFETLGIPIRRGRGVELSDDRNGKPVAVINESAAEKYWPGDDPIGQRITFDDLADADAEEVRWLEIAGVVGDVHHEALEQDTEPEIYWPYLQNPMDRATLVLRAAGDPAPLVDRLREILARIDPSLPIWNVQPLQAIVDASVAQPRFNTVLLSLFAGLALTLAAIGVFGLISYAVSHQLREIGVRLAIGAGRRRILGLVLRQGMTPVAGGLLLGIAGALYASRYLESLIYGVAVTDAATYAALSLALAAVAAAACLLPAWRATRIDPMVVLRDE